MCGEGRRDRRPIKYAAFEPKGLCGIIGNFDDNAAIDDLNIGGPMVGIKFVF
jgi:hypothetical protein